MLLGNNRVQILNSTLQHELSITSDGDSSAFDRPNDVCIDKNGMIIVADTFRCTLFKYLVEKNLAHQSNCNSVEILIVQINQ